VSEGCKNPVKQSSLAFLHLRVNDVRFKLAHEKATIGEQVWNSAEQIYAASVQKGGQVFGGCHWR